jgi:hypothetical protein
MITNKQLLGAILSLTIGTISAQDKAADKRDQLVFGIKAGMNVSNVWDEQGADFVADPKLGAAGGVFLAVPIGKYFGVQPEVLFSQKGFKGGGSLLGFPYSFTRTTSYIDVPILVQFKPIEYFTLLAGPQFSYLLKEKNVYTFGSNSSEQEQAFSNEDVRNNILGFVVGADVTVNAFVVSARAGWDFQNNNKNGVSTTPRYKNQFLQLTIGFRI